MSAAILKNSQTVRENVPSGHFEEKKKKKDGLLLIFQKSRTLNMFFLNLALYSIFMFLIGSLFRMSLIATPCFFHSISLHMVLLFSPHLYSEHLMILLPYCPLVLPSPWVLPLSFTIPFLCF